MFLHGKHTKRTKTKERKIITIVKYKQIGDEKENSIPLGVSKIMLSKNLIKIRCTTQLFDVQKCTSIYFFEYDSI